MINDARQLSRSLVGIYHWREIQYDRFGFVNQRNYERFAWSRLLAGDWAGATLRPWQTLRDIPARVV